MPKVYPEQKPPLKTAEPPGSCLFMQLWVRTQNFQHVHVWVILRELKLLGGVSYFNTKWPLKQSKQSQDRPLLTVHTGGSGSCSPGDLALLTGTAGRLPGDGPSWLAAVPVQRHDLTCPGCQLAWKRRYTTGREVRETQTEWTTPLKIKQKLERQDTALT